MKKSSWCTLIGLLLFVLMFVLASIILAIIVFAMGALSVYYSRKEKKVTIKNLKKKVIKK